MYVASELASRK